MLNGAPLNSAPLNSVTISGGGSLWQAEQTVGIVGSGSLWKAEQTVVLRITGSGSLWKVEQETQNTGGGSLWKAEQRVKDATIELDNLTRFWWDASLFIGGVEIDPGTIHDAITITRAENAAALMEVTLNKLSGIQDFEQYHGKTVTLDVETASGVRRLYSGIVDVPEVDLIFKRITLRCTNRRNEQINEQFAAQLPFIGRWSDALFDEPDNVADELSQRLMTTTATVDFDAYGNYTVADYLPKATADFTLADADIYRRQPTVTVASRGRLINRVNLEFEYRYVRLRHRERNFTLDGPTFCDVMTTIGLSFLSSEGIASNIDSFGWDVKPNSIGYEYLPDAGWKDCGQGKFIWSPVIYNGQIVESRDSDGNTITDSGGNPIYEYANKTVTDYTEAFALSASWTAAKRWAQDISEKINIQISAPQSIAQYGVIEQTQRNGKDVEYDAADYERAEGYQSPTDFIATAGDYYLDKSGTAAGYRAALTSAIAIAETKIIKSHRDYHVVLQVPLWPEVDLKHTVETTAGLIQSKGKVSQIIHRLDISNTREAYTEVQLSLSRSVGSQAAESLTIPILNAPLVGGFDSDTLTMKTYEGDGSVGFGATPTQEIGMVTPAIDDESRNRQTVESDYSYNIPIQNDTLTVTF